MRQISVTAADFRRSHRDGYKIELIQRMA